MSTLGIFRVCFYIFILFAFFSLTSAIRINEFELNPAGTDSGNEWVELYCEEETDLDGWKLVNGDGDIFSLDSIGSCKGFHVIDFNSQWLDNTDEKVILKDSEDKTIDKTDTFADSSNNDKSWQFCDEWIFEMSTKEEENDCPEGITEEEEEETEEEEVIEEPEEEVTEEQKSEETEETELSAISAEQTTQTGNVIKLGDKKSIEDFIGDGESGNTEILYESSTELIKKYGIYAFCLLLIIIIAIQAFKLRKQKHNI